MFIILSSFRTTEYRDGWNINGKQVKNLVINTVCLQFSSFKTSLSRRCKICQTTLPSALKLAKHFKYTHGLCAEKNCKESFDTQSQLDEHILKNHSKKKCIHCNEFVSCDQIKKHIKLTHSAKNVCHLCGKAYRSTNSLLYHCRMEHIGLKKLQCDICKEW